MTDVTALRAALRDVPDEELVAELTRRGKLPPPPKRSRTCATCQQTFTPGYRWNNNRFCSGDCFVAHATNAGKGKPERWIP